MLAHARTKWEQSKTQDSLEFDEPLGLSRCKRWVHIERHASEIFTRPSLLDFDPSELPQCLHRGWKWIERFG